MVTRSNLSVQWVVRALCVLALLFVGFAHKPLNLDYHSIPASELAAYTLPDGTLPVLCLPSEDGKTKHDGHDLGSGCEACRLTASVLLPAPADMAGAPIVRESERMVPVRSEAFYRQLFPPNTAPRGPPSGLLA
ncbi:hypothetical protein J2X76_006319 [Neorhizobium sp. 2083]|uniref:hypothetical protein n=1 Tax=Neorhizobium sp. 2083 TaxID=2817762 RepID=UPI00285DAC04|nr:hypothetical protein [Neorhizobium sp. 2083]MDR6821118.1 hypothetical protein [Neorhizobium sp. 2083]